MEVENNYSTNTKVIPGPGLVMEGQGFLTRETLHPYNGILWLAHSVTVQLLFNTVFMVMCMIHNISHFKTLH